MVEAKTERELLVIDPKSVRRASMLYEQRIVADGRDGNRYQLCDYVSAVARYIAGGYPSEDEIMGRGNFLAIGGNLAKARGVLKILTTRGNSPGSIVLGVAARINLSTLEIEYNHRDLAFWWKMR